jgi:hypothetical protein
MSPPCDQGGGGVVRAPPTVAQNLVQRRATVSGAARVVPSTNTQWLQLAGEHASTHPIQILVQIRAEWVEPCSWRFFCFWLVRTFPLPTAAHALTSLSSSLSVTSCFPPHTSRDGEDSVCRLRFAAPAPDGAQGR